MKDPMKLAKKEFPKYGAVALADTPYSQTWRMPWGERWNVWPAAKLAMVRAKIAELHARMDPLNGFEPADAPPMRATGTTRHFAERLELMQQQANVTPTDIQEACLRPTETRYCPASGSYAYLRGDIAVVAAPYRDGMRLVTVLWTHPDMWARNPRPEKENAHV